MCGSDSTALQHTNLPVSFSLTVHTRIQVLTTPYIQGTVVDYRNASN